MRARFTMMVSALLAVSGCCLTTDAGNSTGGSSTVGASSSATGSSTGNASSTGSASSTTGASGTGSATGSTTGQPPGTTTGITPSSTGTSTGGTTTGFGFQPAVTYKVGRSPYSIAVADYNSDTFVDLAVANHDQGIVSLLWGNGDGTFEVGDPVTIGGGAYWITAADLNDDGLPDLAVANSSIDTLQILFNDAGGFGIPVPYPVGSDPNCVVAADLNGDGVPDLAVTNYQGATVDLFWGTGGGDFEQGSALTGFDGPIFVAQLPSGSLAVANQHADQVDIYVQEDAGLENFTSVEGGSWPTSVAYGDLNHDGFIDLAASDYNGGVSVMLGTVDGGFQSPVLYTAGGNPNSVVMADFNADGNLDLAVANSLDLGLSPGTVSIFLGRGDGTFQPQITFNVGNEPQDVAVGDFNRDGYPDLAVANSGDGTISILITTH